MTEKRDVPIFRIACVILCAVSIGCLIMRIPSVSDAIGFFGNPKLTTEWSVIIFYDIADGFAFCGPFFIGYLVCGLLGFRWRYDMNKANACLLVGILVALGQIITMAAVGFYGYRLITQSEMQESIAPVFFVARSLLAFIPGLVLMAVYFVGVKKMKGKQLEGR